MIESIKDILNLDPGELDYLVKNESWEVSIKKLKNGKWFEINISQKQEYPVARSG